MPENIHSESMLKFHMQFKVVQKFSAFMESKGLSLQLQEPVSDPYPEPGKFSSLVHNLFL